jgi:hypothetical protein
MWENYRHALITAKAQLANAITETESVEELHLLRKHLAAVRNLLTSLRVQNGEAYIEIIDVVGEEVA